ncbi:hypothetical protein C7B61_09595 [filamentous cyanobacterium CCP1]|nr:hypothetical protein C7B61_09595 [filamentous cyanobacterium CCP1]
MTIGLENTLTSLHRHIADYRPQLERAIAAMQILETADPNSDEFSQALADLQVAATILEPYSQGMLLAIDRFTESRPASAD